jgi:competence protein ComGC
MNRIKRILKDKKGITLVECVIAVAVLSIVCMMSFRMFSTSSIVIRKAAVNDVDTSAATAALVAVTEESAESNDDITVDSGALVFTPVDRTDGGTLDESTVTQDGTVYTL